MSFTGTGFAVRSQKRGLINRNRNPVKDKVKNLKVWVNIRRSVLNLERNPLVREELWQRLRLLKIQVWPAQNTNRPTSVC